MWAIQEIIGFFEGPFNHQMQSLPPPRNFGGVGLALCRHDWLTIGVTYGVIQFERYEYLLTLFSWVFIWCKAQAVI